MPNDNNSVNIVVAKIHHLMRFCTTIIPKMNKKNTPAPKYQGPEVKGLSPQYTGIPSAICPACASDIPPFDIKNLATLDLLSSTPFDDPP